MSLALIVDRRRRSLIAQWKASSFFQIQVDGKSMLGHALDLDVEDIATGLKRRQATDVFYVPASGDPDRTASLWVAAGYEGYRSAYVAFANAVYGNKYKVADLAGYDADHLLNRAGSPRDQTFIRLEAVSAPVNQAWGSLYERYVKVNPREGRKLRWPVASKLAGLMPPNGPDDAAGIKRLVDFWVAQGFPREQAEFGIRDDLNRIFGRPHGGVIKPTVPWI